MRPPSRAAESGPMARCLLAVLLVLAMTFSVSAQDEEGAPPDEAPPAAEELPGVETETPSSLPDPFHLVADPSPRIRILVGTARDEGTILLAVFTLPSGSPLAGQPCLEGGVIHLRGFGFPTARLPDGFSVSTTSSGNPPGTPPFRIEARGVAAAGEVQGTLRIQSESCDTGILTWTGSAVSAEEFASLLVGSGILDLGPWGLTAPQRACSPADEANGLSIVFDARLESGSVPGPPPDFILYRFRVSGIDLRSHQPVSTVVQVRPSEGVGVSSLGPDRFLLFVAPNRPPGPYLVAVLAPDGRCAETTFEHPGR